MNGIIKPDFFLFFFNLIYKTPKKIQSIEFFDLLILFIDYTYHRPICKLLFFLLQKRSADSVIFIF